jgi:hypothetical protein
MNKKVGLIALVFCLFLLILCPGPVQAQGGLTILNSSAEAEFPLRLNFNLSARSSVNITDIRLDYTVDRSSFAEVVSEVYVEFKPNTTVDVSWSLEMVKVGGLPTGTTMKYWWQVTDASGKEVESAPTQVRFDDLRYRWRDITEGKVTIYWYLGDESFARELMSGAQQALQRLATSTGASPGKPVQVYIYADYEDLQGALIYPPEWIGGVNYPELHIIALAIGPGELTRGKGDMAHELTHQVTHQMTDNPYNPIPRWLDEGLSKYAEGLLDPFLASALSTAIAGNKLISVQSLCSVFSAIPEQAYLSYAQSYSLVEFLITSYGQAKMLELLETFSQGSTYDGALERVYGFNMDGLDKLWRDYVTKQYRSAAMELMQPALATAGF